MKVFLKMACGKLRTTRWVTRSQNDVVDPERFMTAAEHQMTRKPCSPADKNVRFELPEFDNKFWLSIRNKLCMSTAGILDLGAAIDTKGNTAKIDEDGTHKLTDKKAGEARQSAAGSSSEETSTENVVKDCERLVDETLGRDNVEQSGSTKAL